MSFDDLVRGIYARNAAGCCLHIALDDLNLYDSDVTHCYQEALREDHRDCIAVARALIDMPEEERELRVALAKGDLS